jgi:hypothetical protein
MTITGVEGELRQGYFVAATLGAWSFVGTKEGGTVTGSVLTSNAFRLEQPGISVVVPVGKGNIRWPIQAMQIANGTLSATVGEREL